MALYYKNDYGDARNILLLEDFLWEDLYKRRKKT